MFGMNQFCTSETEAREAYNTITEKDRENSYRLVRYHAVLNSWGSVIGVTKTQEILESSKRY